MDTLRELTINQFTTRDGTELHYRHWQGAPSASRQAIVLLHRGHEHGGRVAHLVDELALPEMDFFAWDARGHGLNKGPRGYSPYFQTTADDLNVFIGHICHEYSIEQHNIFVVGQSVGAVTSATWVHDYAPNIRGMSLASPAFDINLYVPFAKLGLKIWYALRGLFYVNSYVRPQFLTHDPERQATYLSDPLITRPIAVNVLLDLYETAARVVKDAAAITVPTQMLVSGADWVVKRKAQLRFYNNLGSRLKSIKILSGYYHDTLGEQPRDLAISELRQFIVHCFSQSPSVVNALEADRYGHTADEASELARPLPRTSVRGLFWWLNRQSILLGAKLSDGLKLGVDTGFDSGSTLDYVYRNQPSGKLIIGKWIDWVYLNSIGWRGIRQRKVHLEQSIAQALQMAQATFAEIHLADVAAGHGRYVLDALKQSDVQCSSVQLRDFSTLNVEKGQALIHARSLVDQVRFEQGDAFDAASIDTFEPAPNVVIVSGLYELFADNSMVQASLAAISRKLPVGGLLIYTGQPWHPQLELIARALTSHKDGKAWVMRRRTQQELDQLVAAQGMVKLDQRIDQWGIFSVSIAQKRA